jgi:hypothetical protein
MHSQTLTHLAVAGSLELHQVREHEHNVDGSARERVTALD